MLDYLIPAAFALIGLAAAISLTDSGLRWLSAFNRLSKERADAAARND